MKKTIMDLNDQAATAVSLMAVVNLLERKGRV
jgi:hypothetical protein